MRTALEFKQKIRFIELRNENINFQWLDMLLKMSLKLELALSAEG